MVDVAWEKDVDNETVRIRDIYVTEPEFQDLLISLVTRPNSPLLGLEFEVKCEAPFRSYTIGPRPENDEGEEIVRVTLKDCRNTVYGIHYWKNDSSYESQRLNSLLRELFESYWKPEIRMLPSG